MAQKTNRYGNDAISALKGADRVRKRPGVIFGSDGLEGCEHAVFEILSNSIDEAREGHGSLITVTRFLDGSIQVEDQGRGCPVDWNEKEQKFNWELVFCELYAGGKYNNLEGDNYEYSLGLNGLGACATQYASEYMDVTVWRDGMKYSLHFEKGENVGGLRKEPTDRGKRTGSTIRWKPDLEVFTDTSIPADYFLDIMKRQAVVNAGVTFRFREETAPSKFEATEFQYENGIQDYVAELAGEDPLTQPVFWQTERKGRDRADKPEYKVKLSVAFCFSNKVQVIEHYHNSSWLEHGGSPEKAVRSAFVSAVDSWLKQQNKYNKNESKLTFQDIQDCLVLVSNNFSTQTSYENQTKKAINNKFVQEAMTDFLRSQLQVYFIENPQDAQKIADQVLINKRSRENAERTRLNLKKSLTGAMDVSNRVAKFVPCRTKDVTRSELYIVEGDSALGSVKMARDGEYQAIMPVRGKILNCLQDPELPEGRLRQDLQERHHHRPAEGAGLRGGGEGEAGEGPGLLRSVRPAVEQDRHLHRRRRGRLPDPHSDPHHALPPHPHPHPGGVRVYRRVPPVRDHLQGGHLVRLLRQGEERHRGHPGGQEVRRAAVQGSGRERPGHDVADHHEPGHSSAHQGHARGCGAHRRCLRPPPGGRPPGPEEPHRRSRV